MRAVRERFPDASFVGMVGLSAGSGLLVNYLGQDGGRCLVDSAVGVSPAYDIVDAFDRMAESPAAERYMVRAMKRTFIIPNRDVLRADNPDAFDACLRARSMSEFVDAHAPFALRDATAGAAEYYAACNPMAHYQGMDRPVLFLNSEDDMVCDPRNIREDLVRQTPGVALLRTLRGSHVAFNDGLLGQGSFSARVAFDFLGAAREVAALECDLPGEDFAGVPCLGFTS
jgi:predicted alpha/beta-fold hydrolase